MLERRASGSMASVAARLGARTHSLRELLGDGERALAQALQQLRHALPKDAAVQATTFWVTPLPANQRRDVLLLAVKIITLAYASVGTVLPQLALLVTLSLGGVRDGPRHIGLQRLVANAERGEQRGSDGDLSLWVAFAADVHRYVNMVLLPQLRDDPLMQADGFAGSASSFDD